MRHMLYAFAGLAMLVVVGCQQGSSTAPSTGPGGSSSSAGNNKSNNPPRKLTITSPGDQTVQQDKTDEMTVSISRSHFSGPVMIELKHLPSGVTIDTKDLTIPADKTSVSVTIKAAPDAKAVDKHKVTVAAKALDEKDMPEATVDFDLKVKPKS